MSDRDDLLRQVTMVNPVPPDVDLPDEFVDSRPPVALLIGEGALTDTRSIYPTTRWWRGPAIAVAAALVIVVAVSIPLLVRGGQEGTPPADTTPTTIPATTTAPPPPATTVPPVPATTIPPPSDVMQRVGADVMQPVVGLFDMTQIGSRLVAAGFDPGEDFRQDGVIFASDDGVTWTRLAENDPALTTGAVLIYGIAEGGPGLIAVGMSCEDSAFPCETGPHPTVWTSVDGTEWTRTPADPDTFGEIGSMVDVVATEYGIVATGSVQAIDTDDEARDVPTVWLSEDGSEWTRVWQGEPIASGSSLMPGISAFVVGPDELIVGVGSALDELGEAVAAVWVSTDARTWERIEAASAAFSSRIDARVIMLDVAWGSTGLVSVGSDGGSRVAIWQSPDGRSWTRVDTADQPFGAIGSLSSVAALDTGFVTVGPDGFVDQSEGSVTLWTSPDGSTWDRVSSPHTGYSQAVVVTDGGIAVAGAMPEANDYHAAVWAGPLLDPSAPPPDPVPPVEEEESSTGLAPIGAVREGLSCGELETSGYTYAEAVSHWMRYDMPTDLDPDGNGVPCEAIYSTTDVAAVFGEPGALSVRLVSDLPAQLFEASGSAVVEGLVCPSGTTEFTDNGTPPKHARASGRWENVYTCDDGSGRFTIGADGFISVDGLNYGVWDIGSGTGRYETLIGGGGVFTGPTGPGTWSDDLIGRLWLETDEN